MNCSTVYCSNQCRTTAWERCHAVECELAPRALKANFHTQKLDEPSGTAITLAEGIIKNTNYSAWKLENAPAGEIPIVSKRIGTTPGTHSIDYSSEVDSIEIKHTAHNREGFALGAVIAAEWIVGKTGVFTMKDVLNLG